LAAAGHSVTVATHEVFRELVTAGGLAFSPIAGDPQAILDSADRWLATGKPWDALAMAKLMVTDVRPLFTELLDDYWRVAQGSDLLIYSAVAMPVWSVAERLSIPSVAAMLQPLHRTRYTPMIRVPARVRLGPLFNTATHVMSLGLAWQPVRGEINRWRRRTLDLPPARWLGPFDGSGARRRDPAIYGYSPRVVPKPGDWGPDIQVTGYWVSPVDPSWRPPDELQRFLASGAPPIYIGFGSMTPNDAEALTAVALEALDRTGQRGVLLSGWGSLGSGALPPTVTVVSDIPHEWLFPQMRAVVHHGGAGTTGAGLRAGVPSILSPLGFDQPYWGERVTTLGVGPTPIPRRHLTADRLAQAIDRAVRDEGMRERAAKLGAELRSERGLDNAVAAIESIAAEWRRNRALH
jgi:UDP:flavonoid glycosyltransferase YjiC (YdhE family)